jgi:hypothetical protein
METFNYIALLEITIAVLLLLCIYFYIRYKDTLKELNDLTHRFYALKNEFDKRTK